MVINKKQSIIFDDKNLEFWKNKIFVFLKKNDLVLYDVIGVSWLLYFHVTKIKIISTFSMRKYCEYFDFVNITHSVANSNAWANQPALVQL